MRKVGQLMPKLAVLGAGGWGTAMATYLAQRPDHPVTLWCVNRERADLYRSSRVNDRQLPGVLIPKSITITAEEAEAVDGAEAVLVAVPMAYIRETMQRFVPYVKQDVPVVSLVKGIENSTFLRPTEILGSIFNTSQLITLSGPSHAEEVARGLPTSLVVASADSGLAAWVQQQVGGDKLRLYTNSDLVGVEMAGALKNVLGIAAGVCDGLKFGDNAKAALLTRGLVEMQRFGVAHGANPETFHGIAGLGDLITTCFSLHGRNRRVGERIAKGEKLAEVVLGPQVAEGVLTARSVYERAQQMQLDLPIMTGVYRALYEGLTPMEGVQLLMGRPQKCETRRA
jgi:glycerol-3-phosphate dehydrogenase (NAD(P)+)